MAVNGKETQKAKKQADCLLVRIQAVINPNGQKLTVTHHQIKKDLPDEFHASCEDGDAYYWHVWKKDLGKTRDHSTVNAWLKIEMWLMNPKSLEIQMAKDKVMRDMASKVRRYVKQAEKLNEQFIMINRGEDACEDSVGDPSPTSHGRDFPRSFLSQCRNGFF